MGLRINTNSAAMSALRQLAIVDRGQSKNLQRLSTGLRINSAADDPSGLVISEQLRAQTASLKAAVRNSEFASNLIGTAEAALNEVSSLLVGIRESVVYALNGGTLTSEQIAAEQSTVDRALSAIDRIAAATRFGSKSLLDGSAAFKISDKSSAIDSFSLRNVKFNANSSSVTFTFGVMQVASRATIRLASTGGSVAATSRLISGSPGLPASSGGTGEVIRFRITGNLGVAEISLASGSTFQDFMDQVNANTSATGVFASGTNSSLSGASSGGSGASFALFSVGFGSDQQISMERITASSSTTKIVLTDAFVAGGFNKVNGDFTTDGISTMSQKGEIVSDIGQDIVVRVGSTPVTGKGNKISVNLPTLQADVVFGQRYQVLGQTSPTTNFLSGNLITVLNSSNSGLTFQLAESALPSDRISVGLDSVRTAALGYEISRENEVGTANANAGVLQGGFLSSLVTGGDNDLSSNPQNALQIVDAAIEQVSGIRSSLGSLQKNTLDPNIDSLNVAIENLSATESAIRDLDFASETTDFVRSQILFQAAVSTLASANLIPQTVLSLLQ
ncbi:MAG: flagellin [Planctomycetes bacterium]|nr:flagellin [Planctomycetota bacterium]